jgi:CP family cyanate transporter-like MFS transporter
MVALVAVAFNLRTSVTAVAPLIEEIRADTGMTSTVAGILTSLPLFLMGLFCLAGVTALRRARGVQIITWCMAALAVATVLRSAMPTPILLIAATVPIGIAMALSQVALPGVLKERFSEGGAAATGAYVASLSLGSALVAVVVVPLSHLVGGWRPALALIAIPILVALPLWAIAYRDVPASITTVADDLPQPGRRWPHGGIVLGLMFGAQSICYNAMTSWIAALYIEEGWHTGRAAFATAALSFLSIPTALFMARMAARADRYQWIMASAALMVIGLFGLALMPTTLPWLWIVTFGVGNGAMFPLLLALPLDLRDDPHEVSRLSAWMLALGYMISALGPVLTGAIRDATGGFKVAVLALIVVGAPSGLLAPIARRAGRAAR